MGQVRVMLRPKTIGWQARGDRKRLKEEGSGKGRGTARKEKGGETWKGWNPK